MWMCSSALGMARSNVARRSGANVGMALVFMRSNLRTMGDRVSA
jgi:hypothetical protein